MEKLHRQSRPAEEIFAELKAYIQGKLTEEERESRIKRGNDDGSHGINMLGDFQEMGETWSEYKTMIFEKLGDVKEVQAIHALEKGAYFMVWILTETWDEVRNAVVFGLVRNILSISSSAEVPFLPIVMPASQFDKKRVLEHLPLIGCDTSDIKEVFNRSQLA